MKKFDYLVVGSGLYGAIFAHEAKAHGKSVLVVDKRPNIAGNIYTEKIEDINVHKYGAHIFHTNNKKVWNYITQFAEFNRFTNSPVANYKGELYSLPFNMYTFNKMWGVVTPEEATEKIEEQRREITGNPQNLEEQAISLVGRDIYEKLIKGYTEKQWGRDCKDLPAFIIKRLPVRLTFDNNYFNALYKPEEIDTIKRFCDKHNLTPIAIGSPQFWLKNYVACSPFQCLKIFQNADFVITDTFHGTIFAAKYAPKYAVLIRDSNRNKLLDLIKKIKIENHLIENMEEIEEKFSCKKDIVGFQKIIEMERRKTSIY